MIPAILAGFLFHMFLTLGIKNEPFDYVVKSSASSWLQEHVSDLSERFLTRRLQLRVLLN